MRKPAKGRIEPRVRVLDGRAQRVTVALDEGPLSWLANRGMITWRQFEAGDRLRTDYERAAIGPRVTMDWSAGPRSKVAMGAPSPRHMTEFQISSKDRFEAACEAVGRGLIDVLWRSVCNGEGLTEVERGMGWPNRSGKVVLCIALDRLADFYRLPEG
jgi:hypothetical protein